MLSLLGCRVAVAMAILVSPVVGSAEERQASSPALDVILARPVTPGTLGLLVQHSEDSRARETVRLAARHPGAEVRAAAARMAYVMGVEAAAVELRAAFDSETSADAAAEQAATLLLLSPADEEVILRHAARVERFPLEQAARRLALLRPAAAIQRLPLLTELGLGEPAQREVLEIALLGDPQSAEPLGRSILHRADGYSWGFLLGAFDRIGLPPPVDLLVAGLEKRETRTPTLFWIAAGAWYQGPKSEALLAALAKLFLPNESFDGWLLEIIRRQGGRVPSKLVGEVAETATAQLGPLLVRPKVRSVLTKEERARLGGAVYGDPMWLVGETGWPEFPPLSLPEPELAAAFPPGFVASLVEETGCRARETEVLEARAGFDGEGILRDIEALARPGRSTECQLAGAAALWGYVAMLPRPAAKSTTLVLSLSPDAVSCSVEENARARDIESVWGKKAIEPLKRKSPQPVVGRTKPKDVAVALEVSANGCVRSATAAKGTTTGLAMEALRTVAGWRYARFTAQGKPVSFRTVAYVGWP